MKKPDTCLGCPWYGAGEGFVPDELPDGRRAKVVFIYQNPGETEEFQARPMIGTTGQMFRGRFVARHLPDVPVGHANVLKCRATDAGGRRTNQMPQIRSHEWEEVKRHCQPYLEQTLARAPEAILVPMGEYAAEAVTGLKAKSMLHLRGTVLYGDE